MGEIAEDMIEGACCSLCGQYFLGDDETIHEHGYPVVCWDCWEDLTPKQRKSYQKAEKPTL